MDRAREIQAKLQQLYAQAMQPGLSFGRQRELDKEITALECELDRIYVYQYQAQTPGGYYTDNGVVSPSQSLEMDPALVLGDKPADDKKRRFPWVLALLGGGLAAYFTFRG